MKLNFQDMSILIEKQGAVCKDGCPAFSDYVLGGGSDD